MDIDMIRQNGTWYNAERARTIGAAISFKEKKMNGGNSLRECTARFFCCFDFDCLDAGCLKKTPPTKNNFKILSI